MLTKVWFIHKPQFRKTTNGANHATLVTNNILWLYHAGVADTLLQIPSQVCLVCNCHLHLCHTLPKEKKFVVFHMAFLIQLVRINPGERRERIFLLPPPHARLKA
jgi:hypothetical protein